MAIALRTVATMAEAAGIIASDRAARLLAGGTIVMRDVNEGRMVEGTLVRLTDPAFRRITVAGQRVDLGAGVTMAEVLAQRDLTALHAAARAIGGPAVRNMATVGGNLFAPHPYGDFTVALLALDAQVLLQSGYGSPRAVPLDAFLTSRAQGSPGLVAGLQFNRPQNAGDLRFLKVSRVKPKGLSVLSIAAHLPRGTGRLAGVRVAYGAMAPTAIRARGVERALEGKPLDSMAISAARAAAAEGIAPLTDAIASAWYRREVLGVHLARLLDSAG
jgi:CO/xanthine dehydrogenase FAD-binding subunit